MDLRRAWRSKPRLSALGRSCGGSAHSLVSTMLIRMVPHLRARCSRRLTRYSPVHEKRVAEAIVGTPLDRPVSDEPLLEVLAAQAALGLQRLGWRLVLAESCTGGWVAKTMTDIAGSSAWFERGFVTY